jgi:hypothetical protein
MSMQASFALRGRNPDVLTCIANLSNDEVFTPPEFANRMLDTLAEAWAADHNGANLWADKTVKFLDPCTKSGVFLREITGRLTKGLATEIPSLEERVDHILTKQVFGIGIMYLTSLLARRGVYCSKHATSSHSITKGFDSDAGNIWFERMEHQWANSKCTYCGANQKTFERGEGLETHAYAFILDIAMAGTSATLLARKWESALLVNVDNDTLRRVLDNPEAMAAVGRIEGWRSLGDNIIETIINKSDKVKELKNKAKVSELSEKEQKQFTDEEKEYKSKRKMVQEKLIKFATRIPAFMYLTDFRENTLQDVITKLEPDLFLAVTGLSVKDFYLLVSLKVFNTEQMNQAVFAFRRYEDASLRYTGIESHEGLSHYGLYDTVVARE